MLRAASKKSRFPGDTGARGASPTGVFSRTGALLSNLDQCVLALYGAPSTLSVSLQLSFRLESWSPPSVLPPRQASLPRLFLWWRSPRAPSTGDTLHTGAPSRRSPPIPRPTGAPPGAVDRADDIPSLWQVIVGFPSPDYLYLVRPSPILPG